MMLPLSRIILASATVILSGCQGTLTTRRALTDAERNGDYEGVKFYPTTLMQEVSRTTVLLDKGRIIATSANPPGSDKYCESVVSSKAFVGADFSRPMIVSYKPGFLEAYTFNPTISDGVLGGLSVSSTPDQGKTIANLAAAAASVAAISAVATRDDHPSAKPPKPPHGFFACTDGIVVVSRTPLLPKYPPAPTPAPSTDSPSEAINFKTPTLTPISE